MANFKGATYAIISRVHSISNGGSFSRPIMKMIIDLYSIEYSLTEWRV